MTPHPDDTIVALSSAPGPGRRAIVRVSGPRTKALIERPFTPTPADASPWGRGLTPGTLRLTGVHSPLPATLYFFPGPRSYTGQDLAELHTISSPPLVERLVADLLAAGGRAAGPGEFTMRSFLAGKTDLTRAEAVHAVIAADTDADLGHALAQLAGGVADPLRTLREDLLNLLADIEAGLDFVAEDIAFVTAADTLARVTAAAVHLREVAAQLDDRTRCGRPLRVALVGAPNAGKSSLFNALVGSAKAIVSPVAGTTRDYLTATVERSGRQIELIDTAGRKVALDAIDATAQSLGEAAAADADVLLWCVPIDEPANMTPAGTNVILVRTKCDAATTTNGISTSAVRPGGTDTLDAILAEKATTIARSALAPSASRVRGHVVAALDALDRAASHVTLADPPELLAMAVREAVDGIGAMVGAVYTNDLLDRIFSRFCIGK